MHQIVSLILEIGDVIAVLLGCDKPILLRSAGGESFSVIGECFVYGLNDAISILGPLPEPWEVRCIPAPGKRSSVHFYDKLTDLKTSEDPRLGELGSWRRIPHSLTADDPETWDFFQNDETGEVMDSDPRMLATNLKRRGVAVRTYSLV